MKFKLIIDKTREETVVATVHERSRFTDEMELLVLRHDGSDRVAAYTEDGMRMLPFSEIECITVLDGKTYAVALRFMRFVGLVELTEYARDFVARDNRAHVRERYFYAVRVAFYFNRQLRAGVGEFYCVFGKVEPGFFQQISVAPAENLVKLKYGRKVFFRPFFFEEQKGRADIFG